MKIQPRLILPAAGTLAVAVMLATTAVPAQANSVVTMMGKSPLVKIEYDNRIRLSLMEWNDPFSTDEFVDRYRLYQDNHNTDSFVNYINSRKTLGYMFTNESTGYTIKYAWRDQKHPEHMVLVVTPGLATLKPEMWKVSDKIPAFSVIEIRSEHGKDLIKTSMDAPVIVGGNGMGLQLQGFDQDRTFAVLKNDTPDYRKGRS